MKKKWLLILAGGFFLLGVFLLLVFRSDEVNSRALIDFPLPLFIVYLVLIGPLSEELAFRSFFVSKKNVYLIGIITLSIYIYISHFIALICFILFILTIVFLKLDLIRNKSFLLTISYILNAFIFSLVHYEMSDFYLLSTYYYLLFQFSFGLFFIWVTINFGLLKSILIHICINVVVALTILIPLFYPDQKMNKIVAKNLVIEYKRNSINFENGCLNKKTGVIQIKNMRLSDVIRTLDVDAKKVYQFETFMKYNMSIKYWKKCDKEIDIKEVEKILTDKELLIPS